MSEGSFFVVVVGVIAWGKGRVYQIEKWNATTAEKENEKTKESENNSRQ